MNKDFCPAIYICIQNFIKVFFKAVAHIVIQVVNHMKSEWFQKVRGT